MFSKYYLRNTILTFIITYEQHKRQTMGYDFEKKKAVHERALCSVSLTLAHVINATERNTARNN
jgi:hypothetical protein